MSGRGYTSIADQWTDEGGLVKAGCWHISDERWAQLPPDKQRLFAPSDSLEARQALEGHLATVGQTPALTGARSDSQPRLPARSLDESWRLPEPDREASWVLPAGSTIIDGEIPELRLNRAPTVTLSLRGSVWDDLRSLAGESRDGLETAGFLFGDHYLLSRSEVSPRWVTRAVQDRQVGRASLDIPALVAEKSTLRKSGITHIGEIGNWHTHPGSNGVPSENDLRNWLNAHDFLGRSAYFGLILTADPSDQRWRKPIVHAWVVRHLEHSSRAVCERVEVRH